ncbi:MAG: DoxX family protein, partial [Bacteroidia bacterium]
MKTQNIKIEVSYLSVVILRIMLSLIFLVASINHLTSPEKIADKITHAKFGFIGNIFGSPQIAVMLSGIGMIIAGTALMLGFKTRYAAIVLIAILIPITLTIQVGQLDTMGPLFKNV